MISQEVHSLLIKELKVALMPMLDPPTILCECAASAPGLTRGSIRPLWIMEHCTRQKASAVPEMESKMVARAANSSMLTVLPRKAGLYGRWGWMAHNKGSGAGRHIKRKVTKTLLSGCQVPNGRVVKATPRESGRPNWERGRSEAVERDSKQSTQGTSGSNSGKGT